MFLVPRKAFLGVFGTGDDFDHLSQGNLGRHGGHIAAFNPRCCNSVQGESTAPRVDASALLMAAICFNSPNFMSSIFTFSPLSTLRRGAVTAIWVHSIPVGTFGTLRPAANLLNTLAGATTHDGFESTPILKGPSLCRCRSILPSFPPVVSSVLRRRSTDGCWGSFPNGPQFDDIHCTWQVLSAPAFLTHAQDTLPCRL